MESMKRVVRSTVFVCVAGIFGQVTGVFTPNALATSLSTSYTSGPVAISTEAPGPLKTTSAVYKFPPAVDADVLPHVNTEIWARVYWPAPMKDPSGKKRPLLMFLHGNHGTCGIGTGPRNDSSCQYTNEGACPAGYVVTPNHEGYNYAAEHLASWGYVVVSINANRGITCGGGNSDDWGLILARGRLVLKHLEYWNKWATTGGAPKELGSADLFKDSIDMKQVGLMGHSRGGEGVRAALNLYRDQGSVWPAKIPDLDIKAIYEIGAVDGQSDRVLDAPSVAWNQLLPLCDGDVSDLQGRMPFERMSSRHFTQNEAESRPSAKSLQMVWGANHNYFNTEWQTSDAWGCTGEPTHKKIFSDSKIESKEQQTIALQSMSGFFRAHVGPDANPALAQQFDPTFELPTTLTNASPIDRDFIPALELGKTMRVDDFTQATGKNPNGPSNVAAGIKVVHDNFSEPPVAKINWEQAGDDRYFQMNFADSGKSWDVSSFDTLDLRVGRQMDDPAKDLQSHVSFGIALVDENDSLSSVLDLATYSRLLGPPNDNVQLSQTARLPLADFLGVNLKRVRGVRLIFNHTKKASIRVAQVRFGVSTERITTLPTSQPLIMLGDLTALVSAFDATFLDLPNRASTMSAATPIAPGHLRVANSAVAGFAKPVASAIKGSAFWLRSQSVTASRQLRGEPAVEISVRSNSGFPVQNAIPVLRIGNEHFVVSRYSSSGQTQTLVFSVPRSSYSQLPDRSKAQVQYGLKTPSQIWELPEFEKSLE